MESDHSSSKPNPDKKPFGKRADKGGRPPFGDRKPGAGKFSKGPGGDRPFKSRGQAPGNPFRKDGDDGDKKSFKPRFDREGGGDKPRSFRPDGPKSPFKREGGFARPEGGDGEKRAFKPKFDRDGGGKPPFKREGGFSRPGADGEKKAFKPRFDREGGGDKPRSFRPDGPKSPFKREGGFARPEGGDGEKRAFKPKFDRDGGGKPPFKREGGFSRPGADGEKKAFKPRFDREGGGDKPRSFRPDGPKSPFKREGGFTRPEGGDGEKRAFKPRFDREGGGDKPRSFRPDGPKSPFKREGGFTRPEGGDGEKRSFRPKFDREGGGKPPFKREGGFSRPGADGEKKAFKPRFDREGGGGDKPRSFRPDGPKSPFKREGGFTRPEGGDGEKRSFRPKFDREGGGKPPFKREGGFSRPGAGGKPPFKGKPRFEAPERRDATPRSFRGDAPPSTSVDAGGRKRLVLECGSELLYQFRHNPGPADRAFADYVTDRRFLGSRDKKFLSDSFYHLLRNLRRIDEAIASAFDSWVVAEESFRAGFPIMSEDGARAWAPSVGDNREGLYKDYQIRCTDTLRMGLAAVELGLETPSFVAAELVHAWPRKDGEDRPPREETLTRLIERTLEIMKLYSEADRRGLNMARRWSWPDWLWAQLSWNRPEDAQEQLAEALSHQAPFTLRVNTLKADLAAVLQSLEDGALSYERGLLSPDAIRLAQRLGRANVPHIYDGWVEIQDEGSQAVGLYTGVKPGMTVVDTCAGGGGKTLHLGALMENKGIIHAFDIDRERMVNLEKRADRAGVTIVDLTLSLSPKGTLPPMADLSNVDLILIDAPCSGTGTARRTPEVRWRLTQVKLEEYRQIQTRLLDDWAPRVRVGGHIVYATCSLLHIENQHQVDEFLKRHPNFKIEAPEGCELPLTSRGELQTEPHRHGCDGLFAARFVRVS